MEFKIFSNKGIDFTEWKNIINKLPEKLRDIHFLPDYGNIYFDTYGYEPFLAYYGDNSSFIIQPFVKRSINELPFLKEQINEESFFDITNPYGYGGPLSNISEENLLIRTYQEFALRLESYCRENAIVTEFSSLHPLLLMHTDSKLIEYIQANKEKEIIYIDLSLNEEDIWKNIRKGHKSSIKSGRKNGVVIEKVEATKSNIEILNKLYLETMQRNNADTRWFLPENYFSNCFSNLGTSRCSLFFAYKDAIPISASIFLHDFEIIYYHFSGSDSKYYSLNMNNLLVYEVCLWAKNKEYKYFHLGGGVTSYSNDSLYIFKSGFSDKTASLYSVQKIFDISKYSYLNKIKEKYELNNEGQIMNSDYFPLYRRKK